AIATVLIQARAAAVPAMPPAVHDADATVAWVQGWDLAEREVWVAEAGPGDGVVGFLALTPTWLDHLYVAPAAQRHGVGSALLDVALATRPRGFGLWVFET